MIKKLLLAVLLLASAELSRSYAQGAGTCTPDVSCMNDDSGSGRVCPVGLGAVDQNGTRRYDLNGKSPGLDTAFIGVPYSQTVSLKIPTNNSGQPSNNGNLQGTSTQVIDFVQIYAMDNLPTGTTWTCSGGGVTGQDCGFTTSTNTDPCRFAAGHTVCIIATGLPTALWDKRVRTHLCGRGSDLGIAVNQDRYNDDYQAVVRCAKARLSGAQTICSGGVATLSVTLNGIAPFSLTWSDGTNTGTVSNILNGAQTNAPYSFTVAPTITTGTATYSITALSSYSCTASQPDEMVGNASITITNSPAPGLLPTVTASSTSNTICDGTSIILNYGGNAASYVWANGVVNGATFTPTQTDTYSVTGTAVNGCTKTATTTVTWYALPTVTTAAPSTVCEGSGVTLSGSGASTYAWDNSVVDGASFPAASGTVTYSVTGTDANGCVNGTTTSVTGTPAGTVTAPSSFSACDGEIVAVTTFSISPTTYDWTNSNTAIGLAASGTGEVPSFTATNATASSIQGEITITPTLNNCPGVAQTYTITVNPLPTATISGNDTVCTGATGQISIALTGASPWSLTYGSAAGSAPVNNILSSPFTAASAAGTYTVSAVSDNNGCVGTFSGSAIIVENTPLSITNFTTTCNGGTYTVDFDITGGDSLSYAVTGDAGTLTGSHFTSSNVTSGNAYSFTADDKYSCAPVPVTGSINCSCAATATMSGGGSFCPGGSATITVELAGTGPWDFVYSVGGVKDTITAQASSPYTFTTTTTGAYTMVSVTDANCTGSAGGNATVTQTLPTATLTGGGSICADGSTTNLNVAFTGTGPWSFVYTDGITPVNGTSTLSNKPIPVSVAGTYSLTSVSDASCSGTVSGTATVIVNALPTVSVDNATVCSGLSATLTASGAASYVWSNASALSTISDSPTSTKTYTVVGNTLGCTGSAVGTITVNSLPTITIIASPSSAAVCAGASVTLTGSGASGYTFAGGTSVVTNATPFVPSATVTYTVTGTDANNCSNKTTRVVTVNPLPVVGITVNPAAASICSGQGLQVTLTGTGAQQYIWTGGTVPVSNGVAFTPAATATYTVTGTLLSSSCSAKATKTVSVNTCGGVGIIENSSSAEEINIYPNPTTGIFNIAISNASFSQLSISVFDITGTEVFSLTDKNVSSDYKKQIDLQGVSSGLYYIRLFTGNDVKTKKLIVQ